MGQNKQWISLDSCINDYLTESEQPDTKYFKLFHIAFRGMEQLGLDFFYQVKSVKLVINANKTVTLPIDFLNYNKLGISNGLGEIIALKYNDKLTTYADLNTDRIAKNSSSTFMNMYSYSSPIFFNYWNGSGYTNLYGVSQSNVYGGEFNIDAKNGVILLSPNFGWDELILEYTATPTEGEDYKIPLQFREAIISWIAWKDIANIPSSRRGSISDKRDRRHEYFEARRLAIRSYRPFYLDQAYQQSLDNQRLVVKA